MTSWYVEVYPHTWTLNLPVGLVTEWTNTELTIPQVALGKTA